jgi:hypothetical protein
MEEHINIIRKVPPRNVSGNIIWIAKKPRRVKPDILLTLGVHEKLNVPIEDLIDIILKDCNVVAFIKGTDNATMWLFTYCRNPTFAKCGGEAQHLEKLRIWSPPGLPEDSRMCKARQQGEKNLALGCSWCHWKDLET